jgi:hypothetical protein
MNKRLLLTLGTVVLAIITGGAQATLLSDLLNGGSITAGDKVFDMWFVNPVAVSDPALEVDPANIDVTALNDGGLDPGPGLSFSISNGAFDVTGDGIYAFIDYLIGFRVTAPTGLNIKDNSLAITDASVTNSGDNGITIQEFVGTVKSKVDVPGDISVPDLSVTDAEFSWLDPTLFGGPGLISNLTDSASFAPQSQIWVSKDIFVWASDVDETASLTGFYQRFSQITSAPEPTTLLLMAAGFAGMGLVRRRWRA